MQLGIVLAAVSTGLRQIWGSLRPMHAVLSVVTSFPISAESAILHNVAEVEEAENAVALLALIPFLGEMQMAIVLVAGLTGWWQTWEDPKTRRVVLYVVMNSRVSVANVILVNAAAEGLLLHLQPPRLPLVEAAVAAAGITDRIALTGGATKANQTATCARVLGLVVAGVAVAVAVVPFKCPSRPTLDVTQNVYSKLIH